VAVSIALARVSKFPAVVVVAVVVVLAGAGGIASAHTELDYSSPEDGATVASPISEIIVAFSGPVTPVGNGFQVFDPDENILEPQFLTDDDTVFRLQLAPPLTAGAVGVRYEVTSDDGHVVTGSFSFTVDAPSATDPPQTAPAVTQAPTTVVATTVMAGTDTAPTSGELPPTSSVPVIDSASPTSTPDDAGGSNAAVIIAVAAVIGVAAAAFVLVRSRRSGGR
jgi:methionine-rich copper-binding protein CopC